jgi:SAM-dependent methyltransferase
MAIGDVVVPTATPATKDTKAEIQKGTKADIKEPEKGTKPVIKEPEKKPNDDQGSEWENFSVEKWRDAVYTSRSFFSELFIDTTNFVGKLCDDLGGNGADGPLLVEVGCGTGEALVPLFTHADGNAPRAAYTCGMDFNPHFIKYCREQVTEEDQATVRHLVGDAQELITLVNEELPSEWMCAAVQRLSSAWATLLASCPQTSGRMCTSK